MEATLKEEARRRRTTVSQLIRALLEDTFDLVDGVVGGVDRLVTDSVELAQQVRRDARRLGESARGPRPVCRDELPDARASLAAVAAWNEVVPNRAVSCARCGAALVRGSRAYLGTGEGEGASRLWLCPRAVEALGREPDPVGAARNEGER